MYMIWTQVTWIECFIHRQAIYMEESLSHLLLFLANFCKCQWYEHPPAPYNSARKISTYTIPFSSYQLYPWYFQMLMYVIIIPHAHFADRSIFIVQKKISRLFFLSYFCCSTMLASRDIMVHTINEGNLSLENVSK